MVKILSKSEIFERKSNEHRMEIEEGLKLAKKIDTLRESAAKEEINLALFREESLKILRNEVNALIHQKEILIKEIESLEIDKKKLKALIESVKIIN